MTSPRRMFQPCSRQITKLFPRSGSFPTDLRTTSSHPSHTHHPARLLRWESYTEKTITFPHLSSLSLLFPSHSPLKARVPTGPIPIPPQMNPVLNNPSNQSTTQSTFSSASIPRQVKFRPTAHMYPFDHMSKFNQSTLPQQMETHFLQRITQVQQNRFIMFVGGTLLLGLVWQRAISPALFGEEAREIPEAVRLMAERNARKPGTQPQSLPWEHARGNSAPNPIQHLNRPSH